MVVTPQRPVALVRVCLHERRLLKLGMIPDEGKQSVVGDVKGGELGRILFFFMTALGGSFCPCSGFLSAQVDSLWRLCRSMPLSSPFARQLGYYPPELSICLPADIVLPW